MNETAYIYGNTVRKEDYVPEVRESASYYVRRQNAAPEAKRRYIRAVNVKYLVFLTAAMAAAGMILVNYVTLRSNLLNDVQAIAAMEKELSALKQENDDAYARIEAGVDLSEIKRIAISEYGMQYATDGQIITVSEEGGRDYVRQIADIP